MNTIIDGIIYRLQTRGGISRVFREILPRMCEMDGTLNITLLMSGKSKQVLPHHPRISIRSAPQIERFLLPHRVWQFPIQAFKEWRFGLYGGTEDKIWHSTYFTTPLRWKGAIVATVHDMAYELLPDIFNTIGDERVRQQKRRCILSADAVICVSESTRRDLLHFYKIDPDKVWVVPNGYSNIFKQLPSLTEWDAPPVSNSFLLYVGSRAPYKNFKQLIEVYSVWQHRRGVSLVVVGRGWSLEEMNSLTRLGIYDLVHLLVNVDDEALCHLYNKAMAFVFPSLCEGFGIPLLEAMACGCPVVASRIPTTTEVAGDCPVYFNLGEIDDLMLALDKVMIEGRKSQRCQAGLERVKGFSWERTAEQTLGVYRSFRITGG